MIKLLIKKTVLITAFTIFISVTFLPSASANFFPFFSKRAITPDEYSNREDDIETYNNQAIELFEEGRFKEAQELWEKAITIMESPGRNAPQHGDGELSEDFVLDGDISHDFTMEDMPETSEINDIYTTAVLAFKKQKYVASKKLFDRIESQTPDYKATRNYLTILKHKVKEVQRSLSDNEFKKDAFSRKAERGEWEKILKESEEELGRNLTKQVAPIYKEALQHYKKRNFKLAKEYFQEIDSILPNYKDTLKYITRIDVDIRAEEQRTLKEKYKEQALARKKEQEEWRRTIEESEKKLKEKMKQQAKPVYQEALDYYKQREFELAKDRFQEVERISSDYKSTKKYLGRIDQDVEDEVQRKEKHRIREREQKARKEQIVRKREEKRLEHLRELEDKSDLQKFQKEVAARRKDREEWLKVIKDSKVEQKRRLTTQADFIYQEAIGYFKERKFKEARKDFLEVESVLPDYKSTQKYLSKIDREIAKEENKRLAQKEQVIKEKTHEDQLADLKEEEEEQRLRVIESQKRENEFKGRALARKEQRDEWEQVLKKNERQQQEKLKQEAGFVYKEALKAYKKKQWEQAREGFLEVQEILPGYKKAEKYLARLDKDVQEVEMKRRDKAEREVKYQKQKEDRARKAEEKRRRKLFKEDQRKQAAKQRKQAEPVYKFAVSLYKKGDYALAKDKFLEVEEIAPNYRSVRKYLGRVNSDITNVQEVSEGTQDLALQQQTKKQKIVQQREEKKLKQLLEAQEKQQRKDLKERSMAREKDRKEWEKTIKQIEVENKKRLKHQAESIYDEALRYYKSGQYEQAREAFREVEVTMPGYKSTQKYIARANQDIKKEEKRRQVNEVKIQEHLGQKKVDSSATEKNNNLIDRRVAKQKQKELSQQAEAKYRQALALYKANNFIEAKLKFNEVESFLPGYKATPNYLERIDQKIADQETINNRGYLVKQTLLQEEDQFHKRASKEVKTKQRELKAQRRLIQKKRNKQFDRLYDRAVKLYRSCSYKAAQKLFLQIERIKPGYKRTASYLRKTNAEMEKEYQKKNSNIAAQSQKYKTRSDVIGEALDVFEQRL